MNSSDFQGKEQRNSLGRRKGGHGPLPSKVALSGLVDLGASISERLSFDSSLNVFLIQL